MADEFLRFLEGYIKEEMLRQTRLMVICLSLDLYFTFLRETIGKKILKFRRSSTLTENFTLTRG